MHSDHRRENNISSEALVTLQCRHGLISFLRNDEFIGRCLQHYGEWAEAEVAFVRRFVPEGGCVVDVGANVGTHSIAFGNHVGPGGRVLAFEPQTFVYRILSRNVCQNAMGQVETYNKGLGSSPGTMYIPALDYSAHTNFGGVRLTHNRGKDDTAVAIDSLDTYELPAADLIKIDVEGMEAEVLAGAKNTISRLRPVIYAECSSLTSGLPVFQQLLEADYVCGVHIAQAFNTDNFFGEQESIVGIACESNLLGIPSEKAASFSSVLQHNPWLIPINTADDLARAVLDTPRAGDLRLDRYSRPGLLSKVVRQQEELQQLRSSLTTMAAETSAHQAAAEAYTASLQRVIAEKDDALLIAQKALSDAAVREADLNRRVQEQELRESDWNRRVEQEEATFAHNRAKLAQRSQEVYHLRSELASLRQRIDQEAVERQKASSLLIQSETALRAAEERITALVQQSTQLERRIQDLLHSLSWRITGPFRTVWSLTAKRKT